MSPPTIVTVLGTGIMGAPTAHNLPAAMRDHGVTGEVAEAVWRKFLATADDGHADEDIAAAVRHSTAGHGETKAA